MQDVEMIRGKCSKCHHVYDVTLSSMPLTVLANAMKDRQTCPICGNAKMNMLDQARELSREERDRHAQAMGNMKRFELSEAEGK